MAFSLDNCAEGCILQIRIVPVGLVSYLQQRYLRGFSQWVRAGKSCESGSGVKKLNIVKQEG